MTRDKIVRDLAGVVGLVDRVEPFIEIQDTATGDEAAHEMRSAGVRYARVVHLEDDLIRSSIVTTDDLDKVSDPTCPLIGQIDALPPEVFLDWRDFLTEAVNESLHSAPVGMIITVEDEGRPLGVLAATTVAAFIDTAGG